MQDPSQSELWPPDADAADFDEEAANAAYRRRPKKPPGRAATQSRANSVEIRANSDPIRADSVEMPIEIYPSDLDKLRAAEREKGRRDGLGEAVRAARAAIDARFRLAPKEFVIGELPTGLDIGELLEAHNRFLIEYGARAYYDGIEAGRAREEDEGQT